MSGFGSGVKESQWVISRAETPVEATSRRAKPRHGLTLRPRLRKERGQDGGITAASSSPPGRTRSASLTSLTRLTPKQRAVTVLRFWEDLTETRVAGGGRPRPGLVPAGTSLGSSAGILTVVWWFPPTVRAVGRRPVSAVGTTAGKRLKSG
ncbi:hypothetical protein GCM10018952_01790 [Streptosporangium vulgare]